MNLLQYVVLFLLSITICGCSYGSTLNDYAKVEEEMSPVEVKAIMGEPYKITASPENGLNYGLYENEKIKYFLVHVPPHLKYFGFHYKIDEDEFVINFKPTENSIPDSKQETKTSFDYSVSHKHKNKKFVPNELDLF